MGSWSTTKTLNPTRISKKTFSFSSTRIRTLVIWIHIYQALIIPWTKSKAQSFLIQEKCNIDIAFENPLEGGCHLGTGWELCIAPTKLGLILVLLHLTSKSRTSWTTLALGSSFSTNHHSSSCKNFKSFLD